MKQFYLYFFCIIFFGSCEKVFRYSPNEIRLSSAERNLNEKNISRIQSLSLRDVAKFVVIGDSQRFYDELDFFVDGINTREDIDFVIINGDLTDFGQNNEYRWIARSLSKLKIPYIVVIGNHDMLANGKLIYSKMFGPENFSFFNNGNKFICLNSNSRERGYDGSLPDTAWLRAELQQVSGFQNVFVFSHVPPFDRDFDPKLEDAYATLLSTCDKVRLSIHGHQHQYSVSTPYGDEVEYIVTSALDERNYVVITVIDESYEIESVDF